MNKKILFLSGTRADFGKIKPLISAVDDLENMEYHIFVTGMHMLKKYGSTYIEIEKSGFRISYKFINQYLNEPMDQVLSNTILGLSRYIHENRPDMIIVHGDRIEALAGAITGSLNNILVTHIEGGERSGTIDELIRHSITKLSHIHLVSNEEAKKRILQMGENERNIFVIGSPDIDIMASPNLPTIDKVKRYYDITFDNFHIVLFHPVTTEIEFFHIYAKNLVDAILESQENYVVIYPNNDMGCDLILREYERLRDNPKIKIFPSLKLEYFLSLMKHSKTLIGNSSAGIREAPFYGISTINIGTRQNMRCQNENIINVSYDKEEILSAIKTSKNTSSPITYFGNGNSADIFKKIMQDPILWKTSPQKVFLDIENDNNGV